MGEVEPKPSDPDRSYSAASLELISSRCIFERGERTLNQSSQVKQLPKQLGLPLPQQQLLSDHWDSKSTACLLMMALFSFSSGHFPL